MRVAGLLPEGDIAMPNKQLEVEWFYMTFHKSDRAEYMQSGRKLSNKTPQTVVEYFQLINETCENDGNLMHHQIKKIWVEAKRKLRHKLEEQLARKKRLLSYQRRGYRLYDRRDGGHHPCQHGRRKQHKLRNDGSCGNNKRDDRKSPPEHEEKDFKPCCIHVKHAKHLYKECRANPRDQAKLHAKNNSKRRHESSNCNNNCYTSSDYESSGSAHTPMPSDGDASGSNKSKVNENFYLSEGKKNKKRRLDDVPSSSRSRARAAVLQRCAVLQRSVQIQTSIWIGTKRSKMPLSQTLMLQTSKS